METGVADANFRLRQNTGNFFIQKLTDDKATSTEYYRADGGAGNIFNDNSVDLDFRVESNSNPYALFVDAGDSKVKINTSLATDGVLLVKGAAAAQPVITISGSNSNGYTLFADRYTADESILNIGMGYSGANPTFSRSVKPSTTTESAWISSQDTFAAQPAALEIKNDGFRFYHTRTNATTTTDSAVALTNFLHISGEGIIANDAGTPSADFRVESDTTTHMLYVDGELDSVGVGTGNLTTARAMFVAGKGIGIRNSLNGNNDNWTSFYNTETSSASNLIIQPGTGGGFNFTHGSGLWTYPATGYDTVFNQNGNDADFRVESDTNTHMLFVDAGSNHVNIGGSIDYGSTLNVFTTGTDALEIVSDNGNADAGPYLDITRKSGSPADGDFTGAIRFLANNDTAETLVGSINTVFDDVSNASEDTSMFFKIRQAGAQPNVLDFSPTQTVVNNDSFDRDFRVESNSNANMLFVDAGNDRVGIATGSPSYRFDQIGTLALRNGSIMLGRDAGTTTGGIHFYNPNGNTNQLRIYDDPGLWGGTSGANNTQVQIYDGSAYSLLLDGASGVSFDAGANYLDDYEEGNGTPSVGASVSGTVTTGGSGGAYQYTKIGNVVHFQFEFQVTSVSGASGAIKVTLPFTANAYAAGSLRTYLATFSGTSPFIETVPSHDVLYFYSNSSGNVTQAIMSTGYYYGEVTYRAN
jgi:hypothetical protein